MNFPDEKTSSPSQSTQKPDQDERAMVAERLKHLRVIFGQALGQPSAISQERLAGWCGVTRDVLIAVENKRTRLSGDLEARLVRITGAPAGWFRGDGELNELDVPRLRAWYPISLPDKPRGTNHPRVTEIDSLNDHWDHVIRPMMRYVANHEPDAQLLPDSIIDKFSDLLRGKERPQPEERSLWKAFTFVTAAQNLYLPLKLGLLAPGIEELRGFGPPEPEKNLPELNHAFLVLLSNIERGGRPAPRRV